SSGIIEEFIKLKVGDIKEIWPVILELLHEIKPKDYSALPIQPSSAGGRLFSFIWKSRRMKKKMQIQFAINKGAFYYFSLRSKKRIGLRRLLLNKHFSEA